MAINFLKAQAPKRIVSVAALRALTNLTDDTVLSLTSYHNGINKGSGDFYVDGNDTSTPDNDGTVFVTVEGKRIKRLIRTNYVDVTWFGAKGDGQTNDTEAIQKAIWFAEDNNISQVFVPKGEFFVAPPPFQGNKSNLAYSASYPTRKTANTIYNQGCCLHISKSIRIYGINPQESIISSNGTPIDNPEYSQGNRLSIYRGTAFVAYGTITTTLENLKVYGNATIDFDYNHNLYCHATSDGLVCWDLEHKGIFLENNVNFNCFNVVFDGWKGEEVYGGKDLNIQDSFFLNSNASALSAGDTINVINCTFKNIEANAYEGVPYEASFINNRIYDSLSGFNCVGFIGADVNKTNPANFKFIGNAFYNCGRSTSAGSAAIILNKQLTADIAPPKNIIIQGNTFADCWNSLIVSNGYFYGAIVSNNYFIQRGKNINSFVAQTAGTFDNTYIYQNVFERSQEAIDGNFTLANSILAILGGTNNRVNNNIFVNITKRMQVAQGFSVGSNYYTEKPFAVLGTSTAGVDTGFDAYMTGTTLATAKFTFTPRTDYSVASCAGLGGGYFTVATTGKADGAEIDLVGLNHPNFGVSPAVLTNDINVKVNQPMIFVNKGDRIKLAYDKTLDKWVEKERIETSLESVIGQAKSGGPSYERPALTKGHDVIRLNRSSSYYDTQTKRLVNWNGTWWDGDTFDPISYAFNYWFQSDFFNINANTYIDSNKNRVINSGGGASEHFQAQIGHVTIGQTFVIYAELDNNKCVIDMGSGFLLQPFSYLAGTTAKTLIFAVKANANVINLNFTNANPGGTNAYKLLVTPTTLNFGSSSLTFASELYGTTGYSIVAIRIPANASVNQTEVYVNGVLKTPSATTGGTDAINIGAGDLLMDGRGTTFKLRSLIFKSAYMSNADLNVVGTYLASLAGITWTNI